jgi:hypothetical protein
MIFTHIGRSFRETFPGRASEWALGTMLALWAVILIVKPDVMSMQPYYTAMTQLMTQSSWAILCILVGGGRLVVLFVNGFWRRSPHLRSLTSFLSSLVWFEVSIGLLQSGIINTGLAVYPVLFGLDVFNAIRAMGDAGRSDAFHQQSVARNDPNS